jgi:hypothetical protein
VILDVKDVVLVVKVPHLVELLWMKMMIFDYHLKEMVVATVD